MTEAAIHEKVQAQRTFFATGATLDLTFRRRALDTLQQELIRREAVIHAAIRADLGKSAFESYMCETGLVRSEITYMQRHLHRFAKEKRVRTPLAQFPSRSFQKPSPYGVTLIVSPWNYPLLLTLDPLIDAIAAGNTAILKPSAYSPHTSALIAEMIGACFDPAFVTVVTGGREENARLFRERFDYIFFTGSQAVGREVMRHAAEHLTPVTLELGGKSPCIVDKTADLELAARRIVFGKFLNAGQTCVAPDYLYCDRTVKDALVAALQREITRQFGEKPLHNPAYGHLINRKHFDRVKALIDPARVICGGQSEADTLTIAPTLLDPITFDDTVMQEEIFGPVLPVLTFDTLDEAVAQVNALQHPLALYLFTSDKRAVRMVTARCGFGGGCINDTVIHLATSQMGFGGFGESGMGAYHGKAGFDTFSHTKSMVQKSTRLDLPMRYQPYSSRYEKLLRFFLK